MANKTIQLKDSDGNNLYPIDYPNSSGTYTPSITATNTGFAVSNIAFNYYLTRDFLFINGRFNITNAGTGNSSILISYPSGVTGKNMGVGTVGMLQTNSGTDGWNGNYLVRASSTTQCSIVMGAGGNFILPSIGIGYCNVFALIPRA